MYIDRAEIDDAAAARRGGTLRDLRQAGGDEAGDGESAVADAYGAVPETYIAHGALDLGCGSGDLHVAIRVAAGPGQREVFAARHGRQLVEIRYRDRQRVRQRHVKWSDIGSPGVVIQ